MHETSLVKAHWERKCRHFFLGRICCFVTRRCELFNYCELRSPHWKLQEVRIHELCIVTLEEMLGNFIQYFSWYRQVSSFGSFASRSLWKSRSWMVGGSARLWMVNCWRWNANLERLESLEIENRSEIGTKIDPKWSKIDPRSVQELPRRVLNTLLGLHKSVLEPFGEALGGQMDFLSIFYRFLNPKREGFDSQIHKKIAQDRNLNFICFREWF